jgi:hypothetical protein
LQEAVVLVSADPRVAATGERAIEVGRRHADEVILVQANHVAPRGEVEPNRHAPDHGQRSVEGIVQRIAGLRLAPRNVGIEGRLNSHPGVRHRHEQRPGVPARRLVSLSR